MMDPRRLLESGADEVELALLRAAASEEPPADGPLRLAAALGLPVAASTPARADTSHATPAVGIETLAAKSALKWLALAGGGMALIAAVIVYRDAAAPRPQPQPALPAAVPQPAPPKVAPNSAPSTAPASADPAAPAPSAQPSDVERGGSKSIAAEIERLEGVRERLQRGDARAAIGALDAYQRAHRAGVLRQEAALLRIEALARAGDDAAARRAARTFLRDHPSSPHAARVRALLHAEPDAP